LPCRPLGLERPTRQVSPAHRSPPLDCRFCPLGRRPVSFCLRAPARKQWRAARRLAWNALLRNGAYCLDGVWPSEAEMHEHGLGHALRLEAPGGLAYVCTRA